MLADVRYLKKTNDIIILIGSKDSIMIMLTLFSEAHVCATLDVRSTSKGNKNEISSYSCHINYMVFTEYSIQNAQSRSKFISHLLDHMDRRRSYTSSQGTPSSFDSHKTK